MVEIRFRVSDPERRTGPTDGGDTFIAHYPWSNKPVASQALQLWCLKLAYDMAAHVNSKLAYCDVRITADPEVVAEWGVMPQHDGCEDCQAGVQRAREFMAENPGSMMVVGRMHWAA